MYIYVAGRGVSGRCPPGGARLTRSRLGGVFVWPVKPRLQ